MTTERVLQQPHVTPSPPPRSICDVIDYGEVGRRFGDYYARSEPVVIRGLQAAGALTILRWSAAHFLQVLGERDVPVVTTPSGFVSYERDISHMPYAEFVRRSFGPQRAHNDYLYYKNPTSLLPAGQDDSDELSPLSPYLSRARMRNLWISRDGLVVGLHFDPAENLNLQIRGHKRFALYPPGTRGYYPMPMLSPAAHMSRVFREGPVADRKHFPLFDAGAARIVELRDGDMLYLPPYWWHQVESLGSENVNLNFWWLPSARKQLAHWNQALRGYLQLGQRLVRFGNLQKAPAATPKG